MDTTPTTAKLAYTVDEATTASGLGRSTLYGLMGTGELEYLKVGSRRLIAVEALRAMLDAHRQHVA